MKTTELRHWKTLLRNPWHVARWILKDSDDEWKVLAEQHSDVAVYRRKYQQYNRAFMIVVTVFYMVIFAIAVGVIAFAD